MKAAQVMWHHLEAVAARGRGVARFDRFVRVVPFDGDLYVPWAQRFDGAPELASGGKTLASWAVLELSRIAYTAA